MSDTTNKTCTKCGYNAGKKNHSCALVLKAEVEQLKKSAKKYEMVNACWDAQAAVLEQLKKEKERLIAGVERLASCEAFVASRAPTEEESARMFYAKVLTENRKV